MVLFAVIGKNTITHIYPPSFGKSDPWFWPYPKTTRLPARSKEGSREAATSRGLGREPQIRFFGNRMERAD